ncbi:hypothetical protein, partial [Marinitenerispora sediminis]
MDLLDLDGWVPQVLSSAIVGIVLAPVLVLTLLAVAWGTIARATRRPTVTLQQRLHAERDG